MIGLLIASTRLWTTDTDGTPQKQIAVAPSYVRWSAVTIVRLSLHVVLESWLVYRHSRRYRPQPWLLARDVEEAVGDGRMDGVEMAMDFLRPRRNPGEEERAPTPHPDPAPSYAVPPGEAGPAAEGRTAEDTDDREKALQQLHDALERLALEEQDKAEGRDMREERQEMAERLDELAEQVGKLEEQLAKVDKADEPSGSRRRSADVPVLSHAGSASHSRSTTRSSHRSEARRARPDSSKTDLDPVATAEQILADPPAQIAAFTAPSLAEAAKRRAEKLQRYDRAASNLDLWVCAFGFIMWIVGMTVAFPAQPVKSLAPLVFAATMVGMVSNWFTALGFATCFLLWSMGYLLVIIAWLLWHLGILRGAQPALFPRTTAKKLAKEELDKCPLVIYAADPAEDTPEWEDLPGRPLSLSEIDKAKLPHPLRVLGANKATCGICHAEFLPPCTVDGKEEYELEVLRELPCLHTFHRECVDEWLLNHADTCPYCTQSVPDMLKDPAKAKVASQTADGAAGGTSGTPGVNGELEELRRTMSRRRSQRSVRSVRSVRSRMSTASVASIASVHSAKSGKSAKSDKSKPVNMGGEGSGKNADTASISSAGSEEFHDSREMPTPTVLPVEGDITDASRAPSRMTLSTGYETASSSLGLASMRTATPMSRADTPVARTETPGLAARGMDGGKENEKGKEKRG